MTIKEIEKKSGLSNNVAESLYWKSVWLRDAKASENINWYLMLRDKKYRCLKKDSLKKH